jgi:hypothetical protein
VYLLKSIAIWHASSVETRGSLLLCRLNLTDSGAFLHRLIIIYCYVEGATGGGTLFGEGEAIFCIAEMVEAPCSINVLLARLLDRNCECKLRLHYW